MENILCPRMGHCTAASIYANGVREATNSLSQGPRFEPAIS
jgi:hypothetical protein